MADNDLLRFDPFSKLSLNQYSNSNHAQQQPQDDNNPVATSPATPFQDPKMDILPVSAGKTIPSLNAGHQYGHQQEQLMQVFPEKAEKAKYLVQQPGQHAYLNYQYNSLASELQRTVMLLRRENKELNERNEALRRESGEIENKNLGVIRTAAATAFPYLLLVLIFLAMIGTREMLSGMTLNPAEFVKTGNKQIGDSISLDSKYADHEAQFVFLIGVEGVGHHFISELSRESPSATIIRELGVGGEIKKMGANFFGSRGGLFMPEELMKSEKSFDSVALFNETVKYLTSIRQKVKVGLKGAAAPPNRTLYVSINANANAPLMMSYPSFKRNRYVDSMNIDILYKACDEAGAICRHAYMYRDPYDVLKSTKKRHFNKNNLEAIRLYTLQLEVIYAQMAQHPERNIGCFGFLDINGSKKFDDIDRFGKLLGWNSTEAFRAFYNKTNTKTFAPMDGMKRANIVGQGLSVLMKSFEELHDKVVDLCYSTLAENTS